MLCRPPGHGLPAVTCFAESIRLGREFAVDRDQRVFAAILRPIITGKTGLGPNDDMARGAVAENQHRTDRRRELIAHRQTLETITADQFFSRLRRVMGLRVGVDHPGSDERLFHIAPATTFRTRVGPFLGDRGGATQTGIEPGIDSRIRTNDRHLPVTANNSSRTGRSRGCSIIKSITGWEETFSADFEGGKGEAEATEKNQQKETSHALCVCKVRTTVASVFAHDRELFLL